MQPPQGYELFINELVNFSGHASRLVNQPNHRGMISSGVGGPPRFNPSNSLCKNGGLRALVIQELAPIAIKLFLLVTLRTRQDAIPNLIRTALRGRDQVVDVSLFRGPVELSVTVAAPRLEVRPYPANSRFVWSRINNFPKRSSNEVLDLRACQRWHTSPPCTT